MPGGYAKKKKVTLKRRVPERKRRPQERGFQGEAVAVKGIPLQGRKSPKKRPLEQNVLKEL